MGGGKKPVAKQPTKALGIDFQGAQYGPPVPVVYGKNKVAGNCIWYGDFQAIAQQQKQSGGKGGGGSSTTTSYTYKASYQLALCEGPIVAVSTVYNGTSTTTVSALGGVVALGTKGQAPWAHLSGAAALGYSNTALVSFQSRDLGSQASLPNDNFEVKGLLPFGGSIDDADPSAIFADICNDTTHGLSGVVPLGSLTQWSNYCVAAGLFLSPVYDQQDTAQSALEDLLKYANAAAWFSEGVVKVGCYGDQTITGNGVTYTPDLTSVASLGPDDFITNGATAPVTITRTSPADALNLVRVEFTDRAHTYHTSAVVASFAQDINANGMRSDDSEQVDMATNATVARLISQNLLQRSFYVRNQYEFKLSWRYCYLEPFDIVQLTDANTGLSSAPVRILSIEEDEHGLLDVVAEECPEGIGHSEAYGTQANAGTTVDPNADPGPVAGPYLFRGPGFLVGNNKPEIWCAVTGDGNPLWAGCDVYLSHDGTSYTYLCSYARQARYGYITNTMAVQADPDTVSAPNVVLNGFQTQLLGGSQADADQFVTLAMIDGEVVSYKTATLAAGPSYNLSYLRRGGYGTAIAAHSANSPFVRLDDGILRIPVDPSQIGQTIYLKFLSVNCFGRTPRTLSDETAYQYIIGSSVELPDVPVTPDSFEVIPVADGVGLFWINDNPAAAGCTSIEYATSSGGPWTILAQVGPTTTGYHHAFANGATYYYRARSRGPLVQSGWSAYTNVISSTGVDVTGPSGAVATLQNGFQSETVDNATFQVPIDASGNVPGWAPFQGQNGTLTYTPNYSHVNGANVLYITGHAIGAQTTRKYACKPGDVVNLVADLGSVETATAGLLQIRFYDYLGNLLSSPQKFTSATDWQTLQVLGTAPANTAYFTLLIYNNASVTQHVAATNVRLSVNDVRVAGSGQQLGDQRNTPSSLSRGYGAVRSATALTAHSTGAIDVNAHSITMGPAVISYSAHASAITGCAVGSTQYVYTRDGYAGGSPTWLATTSAATANSFDDAYIAGNVTIPSSGASGGGGAGGGGGQCVGVNMFLRPGLRAKDLRWWQWLDCARGEKLFRRCQSWLPTTRFQPCVRIVAEGGAELECSISTPFDLRDGSMLFARDMYGHDVLTDHGWRKVVDVIGIGIQPVRRIHVWGNHFAAGADPGNRIYSHNPVK